MGACGVLLLLVCRNCLVWDNGVVVFIKCEGMLQGG